MKTRYFFFCYLFFFPFFSFATDRYDILINEIMEDPNVSGGNTFGLPDADYIELYNRSDHPIELENFSLEVGTKAILFPAYTFPPNAYLIVSKTGNEEFQNYGATLLIATFPSLTSTKSVILKDMFGVVIDALTYEQDWYRSNRANGGYSLERISPFQPCEASNNWIATAALIGGTPGQENSVFSMEVDTDAPSIRNVYPIASNQVRVTFSEAMQELDILNKDLFTITGNTIESIELTKNDFSEILLTLNQALAPTIVQELKLSTTVRNCVGNAIDTNNLAPLALPSRAIAGDILINEVLFNPATGGSDFIELYNHSDKVIDLNTLVVINQQQDNPVGIPVIVEKLVFPQEYVVLTESPSAITNHYVVNNPSDLLQQDLPTLTNQAGNITVFTNDFAATNILDQFDYSEDMHTSLLNDEDGVSLERLRFDVPTQDVANWQSAAATAGYATPTQRNSQAITPTGEGRAEGQAFTLSPTTISPDGDGFADLLQINYALDQAGYTASIHIYDAAGRLLKKVAQNIPLGTSGSFTWDGTTADGNKAPVGIYVVWVEYFSVTGGKGQQKEVVVVAGK